MMEFVLFALMGISLIGMITTGFNDPLSRRFWEQWRK